MIRVLVVDDDKLVRQGLIFSMPWRAFDMEVIGEASNGANALEFLVNHDVDLLMLDLAMPVMSGIELMQIINQRYPLLDTVVLTFHQDFEYVQEALRLGAIDYIAKAQLEKEHFEAVLDRLCHLIKRKHAPLATPDTQNISSSQLKSDVGLALVATTEQPDTHWLQNLPLAIWQPSEIADGLWVWVPQDSVDFESVHAHILSEIKKSGEWVLLKLSALKGQNRSLVYRLLRNYRERGFFYEHDGAVRQMTKDLDELDSQHLTLTDEDMHALQERCLTFKWVYTDAAFVQLLDDLKQTRLPTSKLFPLASSIGVELNRLCESIKTLEIDPLEGVTNWREMEQWLASIRTQAFKIMCRQPYSEDVVRCIFAAIKLVNDEINNHLTAQDVARRVNMSRSYFSQCFRDITGKPFNDYVRHMRIDRAKAYLLQTDKPIRWVAQITGYTDEKYFSHLFKEQTGMLPSQYRRALHGR